MGWSDVEFANQSDVIHTALVFHFSPQIFRPPSASFARAGKKCAAENVLLRQISRHSEHLCNASENLLPKHRPSHPAIPDPEEPKILVRAGAPKLVIPSAGTLRPRLSNFDDHGSRSDVARIAVVCIAHRDFAARKVKLRFAVDFDDRADRTNGFQLSGRCWSGCVPQFSSRPNRQGCRQ